MLSIGRCVHKHKEIYPLLFLPEGFIGFLAGIEISAADVMQHAFVELAELLTFTHSPHPDSQKIGHVDQ